MSGGGLQLELLESERVLAEALADTEQTSVTGGILCAESLDAVTIEAGDGMIELSDAEVKDGLVKLAWVGALHQLQDSFVPIPKVGCDFLMADPLLVTAVVPIGKVVDGEIVNPVGPTVAMLFEFVNDAGVLGAVIEHIIDELPKVFREAGDFTGSAIHRSSRFSWFSGYFF